MTAHAQPRQGTAPLTVFSPAKINLYLRILGKRPDGYHEIETLMLPLGFGDEITLRPHKDGLMLECDNPSLPTDDSNLALRAARQLAERCGVKRGAKIALTKRTPLAAGLGGGSSNAAAVLLGLKQLWGLQADDSILHELAAGMGSDINFFMAGGAGLCRGRGERIEAIPCKLSASVLLVNPGFGISTKWAYETWAKAAAESRLTVSPPQVSLLLRALAEDDLAGVSRCLFNSLEAPSIRKFPVLELIKNAMRDNGASGALMSGSGATVFGLFADPKAAEKSALRVREQFGPSMWTKVTRFASACNR
ncbi:MAG: 4-(cytidine 5'-diphospho)-2-C-methyl-D-erythritol kinase [Verrucomicrobiia bacterium]